MLPTNVGKKATEKKAMRKISRGKISQIKLIKYITVKIKVLIVFKSIYNYVLFKIFNTFSHIVYIYMYI